MWLKAVFFVAAVQLLGKVSSSSEKGDGCERFDRCKAGDLFRTCSCDADCHKTATCCKDADGFPLMASSSGDYVCQTDRTLTPVFARRACKESFKVHEDHAEMCTQSEVDRADVLGNVLVTSVKTKTTYWNMDCAACNDEDAEDLLRWTVQVTCPAYHGQASFNQRFIENNLMFNQDIVEWGLNVSDGFVICHLTFHQPRRMVGKLKYCAPNMVSGCPPDFPLKEEVAKKCKKYHAERKMKSADVYFRNVHCARCNGVDEDELSCVGRNYGSAPLVDKSPPGEKVRVVFDSGRWLARDSVACSKGNSWDPFKKRCRKIPDEILRQLAESATPLPPDNLAAAVANDFRIAVFITIIACGFNKRKTI